MPKTMLAVTKSFVPFLSFPTLCLAYLVQLTVKKLLMLKRTMGRSLLTLLVITGLAGTINDSSLSQKERKFGVNMFKRVNCH